MAALHASHMLWGGSSSVDILDNVIELLPFPHVVVVVGPPW